MLKRFVKLLLWPLDHFLSPGMPSGRHQATPRAAPCACECDLTSGPYSPTCFCASCRESYIGQRRTTTDGKEAPN